MNRIPFCKVLVFVLGINLIAFQPFTPKALTGSEPAQTQRTEGIPVLKRIDDWVLTDPSRNRRIPLRLWFPSGRSRPLPVLIFSHGMGGSKESLNWLGKSLAQEGYLCLFPTHLGSDNSLLDFSDGLEKGFRRFRQSFLGMMDNLDRPLDVLFLLDVLKDLEKDRPEWKGRIDLSQIGLVGHSFGAFTVLTLVGGYQDLFQLLYGRTYTDPRVKAVLALSPPGTPPGIDPRLFYYRIDRPTLIMTGSRDDDPGGRPPRRAESRMDAFHAMTAGDKYALWLEGAYHHTFGDPRPGQKIDPRDRQMIQGAARLFFDAYLKGEKRAREILQSGQLEKEGEGRLKWFVK